VRAVCPALRSRSVPWQCCAGCVAGSGIDWSWSRCGIETAEDAWARIQAGATLVQAYTGFIYGGPLWPRRIQRGLARLAHQAGYTSISQAIGSATSDGTGNR